MHRLSQIQEAASRDRHVLDRMPVKRERELQLNRRRSPVRIGQHVVRSRQLVRLDPVFFNLMRICDQSRVVVLMMVFLSDDKNKRL